MMIMVVVVVVMKMMTDDVVYGVRSTHIIVLASTYNSTQKFFLATQFSRCAFLIYEKSCTSKFM